MPQVTRVIDTAEEIVVDTTNFDGNLSVADIDVQTALETLDDLSTVASPGGSDGQLQYNNSGSLGGTTGLWWVSGDLVLDDGSGNSPSIKLVGGSNDDAAYIYLNDDAVAGRSDLIFKTPGNTGYSGFVIYNSDNAAIVAFWGDKNTQYFGDIEIDDGSGDSPLLKLIGGANDDFAAFYLQDDATQYRSNIRLQLPGNDNYSLFVIDDKDGNPQIIIDADGAAEFNYQANDADFLVKGTSSNLIFGDAGNMRVGINEGSPSYTLDVDGVIRAQSDFYADGCFFRGIQSELTIDASGAITATGSYHNVDTYGDASSDNLDVINGAASGRLLIIRANSGSRTVVVRDRSVNSGNLWLASQASMSLDHYGDTIMFVGLDSSNWLELCRSNNAT